MASSSFRNSMNSLGWSRRADVPVNTSKQTGLLSSIKSLNPFGNEGSVRLPTTEGPAGAPLPAPTRREEEDAWFALSRWDRLLIFAACNLGALACFVICFALLMPMMRLTKFAVLFGTLRVVSETPHPLGKAAPLQLPVEPAVSYAGEEHSFMPQLNALVFANQSFTWSVGSLLFLASWTFMMGPWTYIQHLTSTPRLPFTATYFGSIGLTLYFSVGRGNWYLTLIFAVVQLVCLLWYLVSYFPMGSSGLRLASSFGVRRAAAWMTS